MIHFLRSSDATFTPSHRDGAFHVGEKLDRTGATASFLCAIHCAVMPFLITVLPLLGLGFLASETTEWVLLACSAILGTLSLCLGFREHRRRQIFGVLGLALAFLVAGRIFDGRDLEWWSTLFMVAGGFTMVGAHGFNRWLCHACRVHAVKFGGDEGCCKP